MTILSVICFGFLAGFVLLGASLSTTLFIRHQIQVLADDLSREGASGLNDQDRIGQLNDLEARCRQLVYSSREDSNLAVGAEPDFRELAADILKADRDTARKLETERKALRALVIREANATVAEEFERKCGAFEILLPWLRVEKPTLISVDFGSITGVDSSTTFLHDFQELSDFDLKKKVVMRTSNLYIGNVNAKLPGEDSDLDFRLASLMAPVRGLISGPRMVSSEMYRTSTDSHLPSSVRLVLMSKVQSVFQTEASGTLKLTSCATTCGASPNF